MDGQKNLFSATDLNDCQAYMDMLKKCRDQIMQQQGY